MNIYEVIEALENDKIIKVEIPEYSNRYWVKIVTTPFKHTNFAEAYSGKCYGEKPPETIQDIDYEHGIEINIKHLKKMKFSIVSEEEMYKDILKKAREV